MSKSPAAPHSSPPCPPCLPCPARPAQAKGRAAGEQQATGGPRQQLEGGQSRINGQVANALSRMPPTYSLSPFSTPPCPPCLPCLPGLQKPRGEQQASSKQREGQGSSWREGSSAGLINGRVEVAVSPATTLHMSQLPLRFRLRCRCRLVVAHVGLWAASHALSLLHSHCCQALFSRATPAPSRLPATHSLSPPSSASQVHSFNPPSPHPLCIKAPPPPAPPLLQLSAKSFASFNLASQVLLVDFSSASSFILSILSNLATGWGTTRKPQTSPLLFQVNPSGSGSALRVCLAGGGEGCGGQHRHFRTPLPGGHAGRDAHGKAGRRAAGGRSHLVLLQLPCARSHALQLSSLNPLPASPCLVYFACISCLHALLHLSLETAPLVGTGSHAADPLTSVAPPLSRLATAVLSLALSPFIPSLPTDQLCVCALQEEGRGGGQHRRFPTPLPCGRAGTRGDGREAALPITAPRESIGVGLAPQGTSPPLLPSLLSLSAPQFRLLISLSCSCCCSGGEGYGGAGSGCLSFPPCPPSHPFPARPSQASGTAAGEQQARGAPGQAAGARAAGQQRRPHQRLRLQYRPCHHTPLEPTPLQVQVKVQVQVGSGSCGVSVGVTCTVVSAGARVFGTFLHCNPSHFRLPFLSALPSLPSLPCQAFRSQGDGSRRAAGEGSTRAGSRSVGIGVAAPASSTVEVAVSPLPPHSTRAHSPSGSGSGAGSGGGEGCGVNTDTPSRPSPVAVQVAAVGGEGGSTPLGWDGMGEYRDGVVWNKVSLFSLMHSCCCLVFSPCSRFFLARSLPSRFFLFSLLSRDPLPPSVSPPSLLPPRALKAVVAEQQGCTGAGGGQQEGSSGAAGRSHGSGTGGDMECTGSSCAPPHPQLSGGEGRRGQHRHSPAPLVAVQVAAVGGEGGSTPVGWLGMGEYRDGVVWNKVSIFSLMHSCCCLVFSACSFLVFAPSLPHACCFPHSHCCPLLPVSFPLPPSQYIEGCSRAVAGQQQSSSRVVGGSWRAEDVGRRGAAADNRKQCSRPAAAVAAEEVSTTAAGSGGLEDRLGVVWYGKLIPSSLSSPFSLQAEGGRALEHWSGVHPLTHLSPFSFLSQQHPAWTTEESLPPLIPPSLSTSQQSQHHGALHGCEPTGRRLWFASALATSGVGFESWAGSNFSLPHFAPQGTDSFWGAVSEGEWAVYSLYTLLCSLSSLLCSLFSLLCSLFFLLCSLVSLLYSTPSSLYSAHSSLYFAPSSLYSIPSSLFSTPSSLYSAPSSLRQWAVGLVAHDEPYGTDATCCMRV
ncbi:unnamed protein product [Closterium sp. NIES-54]